MTIFYFVHISPEHLKLSNISNTLNLGATGFSVYSSVTALLESI